MTKTNRRERRLTTRRKVDANHQARDPDELLARVRQANEQLVLATVHADELVEAARANERAKDEFLAMLGHELRNPLTPIATALDLMEIQCPTEAVAARAMIRRQVDSIVRLVDDLLDVSRISAGKVDLVREPVELAELVDRATETVLPLLDAKGHALVVEVPRGLVVHVDSARMIQVISNLLANAGKYTPDHGHVVVRGARQASRVLLSVTDDGIGISADMLPRVFDRFAQAPQALDRAQGGLGLGLTIVRSLVTLHDGTVEVHSAGLGRGSEFVVALPAHVQNATTRQFATSRGPTAADPRRRILLIEDNLDALTLLGEALAMIGHDVRTAADGRSALAILDSGFVPEIAIVDIGLPGINGYELAPELRSRVTGIRLVSISGYGQPKDRARSAGAGFALHLVKPVTIGSLRSAIG